DGFRFDLATILGRTAEGFKTDHPLLQRITHDAELQGVKLIAEPWDPGPGGYQLGGFPVGWAEWNDRFRDDLRQYWQTADGAGGQGMDEVARRLHGSADIFDRAGRSPGSSVNFVTSHDGFTLNDLVSYEQRHNQANGEDNRDGHSHNLGSNHGVEGPSDDPAIQAARRQHILNLLASLLLAQGTPMLLAGDEFGQSQSGNNNAYAQDNETTWLDWSLRETDPDFCDSVRALLALRRNWPLFRQDSYVHDQAGPGGQGIDWYHPDGSPFSGDDWSHASALMMVLTGAGLATALLFNNASRAFEFVPPGDSWSLVFASPQPWPLLVKSRIILPGQSSACLVRG
ncbi:MAG TPA: glycogen debranching enzyme GlgX, partial [Xanthomonadales bacterium]|nr:glycogen debranching enzyme GlgX [Xanthomonadales bacterium]